MFASLDAVDDAVQYIKLFYRRYHSLRYVGDRLIIRLTSPIDESVIKELKNRFSDMLMANGDIQASGPLPEETDEPDIRHLPRLAVDFNRADFGRLKEFIDAVNTWE